VIAITTYTEPVPVDAVVSDPLKTNENEETEERPSFSELLAGMLQNQSAEPLIPDFDLDAQLAGQIKDGSKLDLSADTQEIDLSACDIELSQDSENILLRADQLFINSMETEVTTENESALEISRAKALFDKLLLQTVLPTLETGQSNTASQLNTALEIGDIAELSGNRKKTNTLSKLDSEDALSAKNKVGEEKEALLSKTNENKEQPTRLEEFRNRSRKDKVNIEVRDFRTVNTNADGTQTRAFSIVETAVGRANGQNAVQQITLDLRLPDQGQTNSQNSWEVKSGNMLENMLARELHQNFNGDIVRHASMALRDGGNGTIKIALHPETLGNVKIHLEMTENKITGRIVVESEEALNAFRKELSALEQAFKDSGYANADLNLSLTADGSGAQEQEFDENSFSSRMAASCYEDGFEQESAPVISVILGRGSGLVNMLA